MSKEIKNYIFKPSHNLQIEIVQLETLTTVYKQMLVSPHRTNFYHIFLFENCSPTHFVDFNPVKVKPYTLLFIGKDQVHQFDQLLKYEGLVLIFTDNFFCTSDNDKTFLQSSILFNDLSDKPNFPLDKSVFNRFLSICNEINEELKLPADSMKHNLLKNLLHNFLLLAEREKRKHGFREIKKGADLDYVLLFRDLLEKHFAQLKNVSAYAEKLHVSEKRLGQATAKVLGKKPKELIDDRILLEAKRLLVHASQSIKEIGFQLGFEEPTNFIKYFRKHTAQTPVEFRENNS
jgi:AraC family transcriptional activator of pobA